jgi:hypothetical protein
MTCPKFCPKLIPFFPTKELKTNGPIGSLSVRTPLTVELLLRLGFLPDGAWPLNFYNIDPLGLIFDPLFGFSLLTKAVVLSLSDSPLPTRAEISPIAYNAAVAAITRANLLSRSFSKIVGGVECVFCKCVCIILVMLTIWST